MRCLQSQLRGSGLVQMDGDRHVTRSDAGQAPRLLGGPRVWPYAELADRIKLLVLDGRCQRAPRLPAERELASAPADQPDHRGGRLRPATPDRLPAQQAGLGQLDDPATARAPRSSARSPRPATAPRSTWPTPHWPRRRGTGRRPGLGGGPAALPYVGQRVPALRAGLAARRGGRRFTKRGLPTTRDQILITCGAQQRHGRCVRRADHAG